MREWIETASLGIEWLAVVAIVGSILFGSMRFLVRIVEAAKDPFKEYKELIGNSLLLGLEFLVAADVIRTVALDGVHHPPTGQGSSCLAVFLSLVCLPSELAR
jgi:uncharacterized membrane protein